MKCYTTASDVYTRNITPWSHFEISNFFTNEMLEVVYDMMKSAQYKSAHEPDVHHSWTKNVNRYEYMLSRELYNSDDQVRDIVDQFKHSDNIEYLEYLTKKTLRGDHMLRMSIWKDNPGYKLSVHPDSTYKLLTAQVYLPIDETAEAHLGTSLYDQKKQPAKKFAFKKNAGYMFVPNRDEGQVTYHGLEETVDITRHSFMINIFDRLKFEQKMKTKNSTLPEDNVWHEL